jgi:hypothetical protein
MIALQTETVLSETILETWKRIRSSAEIESLLTRRELALTDADIDE